MSEKLKPWESDPALAELIGPVFSAIEKHQASVEAVEQERRKHIREALPKALLPYVMNEMGETLICLPGLAPMGVTWRYQNEPLVYYVRYVVVDEKTGVPEYRPIDDDVFDLPQALEIALRRANTFDEKMAEYQKKRFGDKKKKAAPAADENQVAPLVAVNMDELIRVIRDVVIEMKENGDI